MPGGTNNGGPTSQAAQPLTGFDPERGRRVADIVRGLLTMHPKTLWAIGSMEEGPFARLCWPMQDGSYVGGYVEADGSTVAEALLAAIAKGRALDGAAQ